MRIDWEAIKRLKPGVLFNLPKSIDWSYPTNVPLMVDAAVWWLGLTTDDYPHDELITLETIALDHMPEGRESVIRAVQEQARVFARAGEYTDVLDMDSPLPVIGEHDDGVPK